MKKLLFLSLLAILCGCNNSAPNKIQTKEKKGTYGVTIFRHGNHQYIFVKHMNAGGLCHYEDCDYCKAMKEI